MFVLKIMTTLTVINLVELTLRLTKVTSDN